MRIFVNLSRVTYVMEMYCRFYGKSLNYPFIGMTILCLLQVPVSYVFVLRLDVEYIITNFLTI